MIVFVKKQGTRYGITILGVFTLEGMKKDRDFYLDLAKREVKDKIEILNVRLNSINFEKILYSRNKYYLIELEKNNKDCKTQIKKYSDYLENNEDACIDYYLSHHNISYEQFIVDG